MKKAEIIKNGNVNMPPIKKGIDWVKIKVDFAKMMSWNDSLFEYPTPLEITKWFKERIEKELNQ